MANKKSGLLSKVPLPDTFFSIKHQLRPIAPLRLSAPSAVVVYLLAIGGFVGCWIIYSAAGPTVTYTVTQQEWQKEGYECIPLQNEPKRPVTFERIAAGASGVRAQTWTAGKQFSVTKSTNRAKHTGPAEKARSRVPRYRGYLFAKPFR